MGSKVRRVDFSPDEYVAGVGGVLRADEQGVYWMLCSLIMAAGGPIERNDRRFAALCLIRSSDVAKIIEKLTLMGKIGITDGGKLTQKRAQSEVEVALKRIQTASENGSKGGRPSIKDKGNQQTEKADGSFSEKLTTNYQLPPEDNSLRSLSAHTTKAKRGTRLSSDWVLPRNYGDWALAQGLSRERVLVEAEKMKNWSINAGRIGAKVDWFAAWKNWVQEAIDRMPKKPSAGVRVDASKPSKTLDEYTEGDWKGWLDYCRPRGEWAKWLGPPPFTDGCLVPSHLLTEKDRKMSPQVVS